MMTTRPCAEANPAGASRLQSLRPVRRVAGSLGRRACNLQSNEEQRKGIAP